MQHLIPSMDYLALASARGPLSTMHALDVMWVSFYAIAAMLVSAILVAVTRRWVKNGFLSFVLRLFSFGIFAIGSILMVLVVFTWPN